MNLRRIAWLGLSVITACSSTAPPPSGGSVTPSPPAASLPAQGSGGPAPDVAPLVARLHAPFSGDTVDATIEALAAAGIQTFPDDLGTTPIRPVTPPVSPLAFARFQVRNMALDVAEGTGVAGTSIDVTAKIPEEGAAMSDVVGAYAETDRTFGARLSHALVAGQPLDDPSHVAFPILVLALFVSDMANPPATGRGPPPIARTALAPLTRPPVRAAAIDPCGAFNAFVDKMLQGLSDQLAKVFGDNPIAKAVIDLLIAKGVKWVGAALLKITGLKAIIDGLTIIAMVASIVAALRDWTVKVESIPTSTHYAVGAAQVTGRIRATVEDPGSEVFAGPVRSCAQTLGIELPKGGAPGSRVEWDFLGTVPAHATQTARDDVVPDTKIVIFDYRMTSESAEAHERGPETVTSLSTQITIDRIDRKDLARIIDGMLGPILSVAAAPIRAEIDKLANPTGFGFVLVTYHSDPDPTPAPSSTATSTATAPPRGVWVKFDRPVSAATGNGPLRIVEIYGCDGPYGRWQGNLRTGNSKAGQMEIPATDIPVSFVIPGSGGTQSVVTTGDAIVQLPFPFAPLPVHWGLRMTVTDGKRMKIEGIVPDTYPELASLPIEAAPRGSCPGQ